MLEMHDHIRDELLEFYLDFFILILNLNWVFFLENLLDSHNPHGIGRTTLRPPSTNNNDKVSTVQQTFTLSTGNSEIDPVLNIFSPRFSFFLVLKEAWNDVSVNVALSNGLVVSGNRKNWTHWSVFGHEVCGFSGSGQANDGFGGAFDGGFDARDGDCFSSRISWTSSLPQIFERQSMINCWFRFPGDQMLHSNGFNRVNTFSSLTRQHNTISTVQNSIGHIRNFGPGWPRR